MKDYLSRHSRRSIFGLLKRMLVKDQIKKALSPIGMYHNDKQPIAESEEITIEEIGSS